MSYSNGSDFEVLLPGSSIGGAGGDRFVIEGAPEHVAGGVGYSLQPPLREPADEQPTEIDLALRVCAPSGRLCAKLNFRCL